MATGVRARAAYLAYRAGADLTRVVPPAFGSVVADGLGRFASVPTSARRDQVVRNLLRVSGGRLRGRALDRAVRETFVNYARYWHETFRLPSMSPAQIRAGFEFDEREILDDALAAGRGAILALPHLGHWDAAGAALCADGYRLSAVAEVVEPPELFEWFVRTRESVGMEVIPLGPDSAGRVTRSLADGRVVCLLADRDLSGTGIEVEFFGERTTVPGGPALLALRTGAPLVAGSTYFTPRGHVGRFLSVVPAEREGRMRDDVARVTQALVREMETAIRLAPEQWLMMQPNWPSDRVRP